MGNQTPSPRPFTRTRGLGGQALAAELAVLPPSPERGGEGLPMACYVCHRRATGTCNRCGRPYCDAHGRELCRVCASPTRVLPADFTYRSVLAASVVLAVLGVLYLVMWPTPPTGRPRTALLTSRFAEPSTASVDPVVPTPAPAPTLTPTPAPPTPTPTPTPALEYSVVPGDTLLAIAVRYGTTVDALVQTNGLSSPNALLRIDQVLTIPR